MFIKDYLPFFFSNIFMLIILLLAFQIMATHPGRRSVRGVSQLSILDFSSRLIFVSFCHCLYAQDLAAERGEAAVFLDI